METCDWVELLVLVLAVTGDELELFTTLAALEVAEVFGGARDGQR